MMDKGQIIFEARDNNKKSLTIEKLMIEFQRIRGTTMANDRALL
jgi:putative tryptophan/tyrosine transport system ATP-binding protein